ncbi:MAG: hypothetical protein ABI461_24185 [Polyangiaceae bacterium]
MGAWMLSGCGGAALLHGPVADRCESTGLKGCDEIAHGVIDVADGKRDEGLKKLAIGAAHNAPDDVRAFADKLDAIASLPGLGSYGPTLQEVARALRDSPAAANAGDVNDVHGQLAAKSLEAAQLAVASGKRPSVVTAEAEPKWRVGTARPGEDGDACHTVLGESRCERVLIGPAEVTSLVAGGGCAQRLMVFAGSADAPRWNVVLPVNGSLALTSAVIPLDEDEKLEVATTSEDKLHPSAK